jgi:uncharacterized damage-inducible protein DinB
MTAYPPAIEGCLEACRRCRILVDAVTAQDESTSRDAYSAIGPHLRHCLDHFTCFLRGFDSGTVDYDARDRDERQERDPQHFVRELDAIVERLQAIESGATRRTLEVCQEVTPDGRSRTVSSNAERELMFLSSHTIHHIAIMSLLAKGAGMTVPDDLGVAFSTASYMNRTAIGSGA